MKQSEVFLSLANWLNWAEKQNCFLPLGVEVIDYSDAYRIIFSYNKYFAARTVTKLELANANFPHLVLTDTFAFLNERLNRDLAQDSALPTRLRTL